MGEETTLLDLLPGIPNLKAFLSGYLQRDQLMVAAFPSLFTAAALFFWQSILNALILPLCIMFWWHWFGLRRQRWIPLAGWLFA